MLLSSEAAFVQEGVRRNTNSNGAGPDRFKAAITWELLPRLLVAAVVALRRHPGHCIFRLTQLALDAKYRRLSMATEARTSCRSFNNRTKTLTTTTRVYWGVASE